MSDVLYLAQRLHAWRDRLRDTRDGLSLPECGPLAADLEQAIEALRSEYETSHTTQDWSELHHASKK